MSRAVRLSIGCLSLIAALAIESSAQQAGAVSSPSASGKTHTAFHLEVLSDTKGANLGPYLTEFMTNLRKNWYSFIPEEARPPQLAAGVTSIELTILKTGQTQGIKIVRQSGSYPFDRAGWGGVVKSLPAPPLPSQFKGEFLELRMQFYYNPEKLPPDEQPTPPPGSKKEEKHGV